MEDAIWLDESAIKQIIIANSTACENHENDLLRMLFHKLVLTRSKLNKAENYLCLTKKKYFLPNGDKKGLTV